MNQEPISKYDSEFCGSLPIHLINVVQEYGVLLVVQNENDTIIQVSENAASVFNEALPSLIGSDLKRYLAADFHPGSIQQKTPVPISLLGTSYLAIFHHQPDYYLIEINLDSREEALQDQFFNLFSELRQTLSSIETAKDIRSAATIAAKELKTASGFDKVMIYQFDKDWNGHVLAEAMEPDMESYINFTFPASDIPKQARDLYHKNPYRFIPDRDGAAIKMYPVINPVTQSFVDISACNVRGVSAVHLEYLKNMHVTASMSTRILKDNQLWGLIACHHKTKKRVNYKICAMFELLSEIISTKTAALEAAGSHQFQTSVSETYGSILGDIYRSSDMQASLFRKEQNVLDLFNATGAVLVQDEKFQHIGEVPGQHDLEDLVLWVQTRKFDSVYVTESLSDVYDYSKDYVGIASGIMIIPISEVSEDYLLLLRPEAVTVINWGGDPETRITFEADMKTYHPRFSFKLWQENVNGVSLPWKPEEISTATKLSEFLKEYSNYENAGRRKN